MAQQFFIRRGDQEQGPFTPEQIKELAASGKLVASDLVRTAEKAEWRQAGTIKGLFGADRPATTTANVASTVQSGLTDEIGRASCRERV